MVVAMWLETPHYPPAEYQCRRPRCDPNMLNLWLRGDNVAAVTVTHGHSLLSELGKKVCRIITSDKYCMAKSLSWSRF